MRKTADLAVLNFTFLLIFANFRFEKFEINTTFRNIVFRMIDFQY